ncbi:hypothetical protein COV19_02235 [Candidatus Woesearchaeota archaeon CG10_big_fil_rev_8_21_14_0_10_44_13]|nr:MAG: hypothetical protein COV19_02235 [Candidatus Woesearchaeota archaeon CG10_big_fil_rev_8_21_14_0_10_44_13]
MAFNKNYILTFGMGIVILILDIAMFYHTLWFIPLIVVALTIGWSQYWIDFFMNIQRQKNIEARFPDFVRYLAGAIKSGMPVSRAIIYVSKTDFGDLTPYVKKLANQVEWSIPVHKALNTFANETKNAVIRRAIATVVEAERAGGNLEDVLESVTNSVIEIKKMKQRRRASIQGQIIQNYVIFIVFLVVMIVVQNMVVPYVTAIGETESRGSDTGIIAPLGGVVEKVNFDFSSIDGFLNSMRAWFTSLRGVFLMIALIQGFFTGIVIGKLAEGQMAPGLKHSLILMTIAFFVITLSQGVV